MNCFGYEGTTFGLLVFFPEVLFHSRVTGACPVTTDLIVRVNVSTTTTRYLVAPWHVRYLRPGMRLKTSAVSCDRLIAHMIPGSNVIHQVIY